MVSTDVYEVELKLSILICIFIPITNLKHTHKHTYSQIHTHTHKHTYSQIHTHTHTHIHTHKYTHTYTHTHKLHLPHLSPSKQFIILSRHFKFSFLNKILEDFIFLVILPSKRWRIGFSSLTQYMKPDIRKEIAGKTWTSANPIQANYVYQVNPYIFHFVKGSSMNDVSLYISLAAFHCEIWPWNLSLSYLVYETKLNL